MKGGSSPAGGGARDVEARSPRGPAARQAMGQLYNVGLFGCEINKGEETRPTSVVPFLVSITLAASVYRAVSLSLLFNN